MDTQELKEDKKLIETAPKSNFLKRTLQSIRSYENTAVIVMFMVFVLDITLLTAVGKYYLSIFYHSC